MDLLTKGDFEKFMVDGGVPASLAEVAEAISVIVNHGVDGNEGEWLVVESFIDTWEEPSSEPTVLVTEKGRRDWQVRATAQARSNHEAERLARVMQAAAKAALLMPNANLLTVSADE